MLFEEAIEHLTNADYCGGGLFETITIEHQGKPIGVVIMEHSEAFPDGYVFYLTKEEAVSQAKERIAEWMED